MRQPLHTDTCGMACSFTHKKDKYGSDHEPECVEFIVSDGRHDSGCTGAGSRREVGAETSGCPSSSSTGS